jgi:murein DD-endopeptidase MepM/ murein hydrolase activator NlpD
MKQKKKKYTVVFIPDDHGKTFSIRINRNIFRYIIFSGIVIFIGLTILIYNAGIIGVKLQLVHSLKMENTKQKDENKKLLAICENVRVMENYRDYLERIARSSTRSYTPVNPEQQSQISIDPETTGENTIGASLASTQERDGGKVVTALGAVHETSKINSPGIIPVQGWITKRYAIGSQDNQNNHAGLDFAATEGSLIRASWSGVVEDISIDKYLGNIITLKHPGELISRYGHCSQILVSSGDHVEAGQTIALVGNTGRSSGPHLHFEIMISGKSVDPLKFIYISSL